MVFHQRLKIYEPRLVNLTSLLEWAVYGRFDVWKGQVILVHLFFAFYFVALLDFEQWKTQKNLKNVDFIS